MTASTPCPQRDHLSRVLAGNLSADEQHELTAHLDGCPRCRQELERLASGEEGWAETARKLGAACAAPEPRLQEALADLRGEGFGDRTQAEEKPAAEDLLAFLSPSGEPGHLGRLGHYEVIEIVGRGGMGVVLKAFDTRLHRIVAVKVMAPALASSGSARQRFLREARAAAAVRNDHVIDIHHVGEENGLPYLVMEYIAGRSLQERLDESGPLQLKEVLRIGMQTAHGLAAAHAQGLIHRDIKPANILLENGVERVKITDFGLARAVDDASLTQSGVITGTPQYMSPEQARGEAIDHRTDLFSLGSLIYAMCAGRPPYLAGTTMGVLRLVSDATPRPIRQINPDISERLAEIIEKLHAKDADQRFQSAAEVAEALSEHLAELQHPESVRLAPRVAASSRGGTITSALSRVRRARKFRWRTVMKVATIVSLLLAALALAEMAGITHVRSNLSRLVYGEGTLVWTTKEPNSCLIVRRNGEEVARLGGDIREVRLRPGEYYLLVSRDGRPAVYHGGVFHIAKGTRLVIQTDPEENKPGLKPAGEPPVPAIKIEPEPLPAMPPGTPMNEMALVSQPTPIEGVRSWTVETVAHRSAIEGLAYSPDRRLLATGERGGVIRFWEADTGRLAHTIVTPSGWLIALAWSPDGKMMATAYNSRAVHFWEVASGRLLRTLQVPTPLQSMAWSPDGRTLATCGWDNRIRLWDVRAGQLLETLSEHKVAYVRALAFSPDSKTLASGSVDRTVCLWEVGSGQLLRTLTGHEGEVKGIAWSPDGKSLATASYDHSVRLWDAVTGECRRVLLGHKDDVYALAWSPDGAKLASGAGDRSIRVWDVASGARLRTLEGHEHLVSFLTWSPDNETLTSGSWDATVRVWQTSTGQTRLILPGLTPWAFNHVRWSPDGRMLASGAVTARLWEASTGLQMRALPASAGIARAWTPDSKILLTTRWDHSVGMWDAATGLLWNFLKGHTGAVHAVACSRDGKRVASAGEDHTLRLWDAAIGQLLDTFQDPTEERIRTLDWSLDGRTLFSGGAGPTVRVWDVAADKLKQNPRTMRTGPLETLAVSPDGRILATGGQGRLVQFWGSSTGQLQGTLEKRSGAVYSDAVYGLAWAPDGKTLASAGGWGEVRLGEPNKGRLLRMLKASASPVVSVTWSADGRALAAGIEGPAVYLWDAATGRQRAVLLGLPNDRFLTVSAEGHYRCSVGGGQQLRYVVQTDKGQETLTPEEFTRKYHWKNDPNLVRPTSPDR